MDKSANTPLSSTAQAPTFTFDYPDEWMDASTVTLLAPPVPGCTPNITVTQEVMPSDADFDAWQERQAFSSSTLSDYTELDRGERMLGSVRAQYWSYLWTAPSGERIWQMQACAVSPAAQRIGVTVTCTCLGRDRNQWRDLFGRMLATFRWR